MRKPREFWIEFGGDPSNDKEVYKRYSATKPFKPSDFSEEVVHCREILPNDDLLELHRAVLKKVLTAMELFDLGLKKGRVIREGDEAHNGIKSLIRALKHPDMGSEF